MSTSECPTWDETPEPAGDKAVCRGLHCGATIWWQITANGKRMPVNRDGTPHWATCPDSKFFKRRKQ